MLERSTTAESGAIGTECEKNAKARAQFMTTQYSY